MKTNLDFNDIGNIFMIPMKYKLKTITIRDFSKYQNKERSGKYEIINAHMLCTL